MADTDLVECSCLEVFGEDPDCPLHGIDALEARLAEQDARIAELETEIERMTPKFVAYEYLESPAKREIAERERDEARAECEGLRALLAEVTTRFEGALEATHATRYDRSLITKSRAALSQKETGDE